MGGGVAMRAAAKAAGIGVFTTGIRGGESPVVSVARRTALSSVANSGEDLKLVINGKNDVESVEKPAIDDWEFAGEEEDEIFIERGEPNVPRLVFGGAPTIQEARQATADLNFALEQTYLSTNATDGHQLSDLENVVANLNIASERVVTPLASNSAIKAFRLLNENPAAQTVVASIASDPNVWNAVFQNADLVDFLQSQKTETDPMVNYSSDESSEAGDFKSGSGKGIMEYVVDIKQKITVTVVDMMKSLSDTFQSFFGGLGKDQLTVNPDGTAALSIEKTVIGASLMGLAIMVISVVVLKRPAP